MNINDVFQSNTLRASDLKGREHRLCIASVELKKFNDGDKLVLTFQNAKKQMVCNATNSKRIAFMHGDDTDGWMGKEITLYPDLVDFQGQMKEAIRVRPVARAPAPQQPPPRPAVAVQQHSGVETSTISRHPNAPGNDGGNFHSDDIPF